jgi:hypothetical protein
MTPDEERILTAELRRAELARDILDKPIVKDTLAGMRSAIFEKWVATKAGEVDAREFLWHHYHAVLKFEEVFREAIQTGQLAANMLERE